MCWVTPQELDAQQREKLKEVKKDRSWFAFAAHLMVLSCVMLLANFLAMLCKWNGLNCKDLVDKPFWMNLIEKQHKREPPDKSNDTTGLTKTERKKAKSKKLKPIKQKVKQLSEIQKINAQMKQLEEEMKQMEEKSQEKQHKSNKLFRLGLMAALNVMAKTPTFITPRQQHFCMKLNECKDADGVLNSKSVVPEMLPELRNMIGMNSTTSFLGEGKIFDVVVDSGCSVSATPHKGDFVPGTMKSWKNQFQLKELVETFVSLMREQQIGNSFHKKDTL